MSDKEQIIKINRQNQDTNEPEYFSISGYGKGYNPKQFDKFLKVFIDSEGENIFGKDMEKIIIRSMFGGMLNTDLLIPGDLITNLSPDKMESFKNLLQPIYDRKELNKRNSGFANEMLNRSKVSFCLDTELNGDNSFEVQYKLKFFEVKLGKNDPTTRLHKVINDLLGENLIQSKMEYGRVDYTPYTLIIDDKAMDAIHNSANFDKIVAALINPEEVCREHRKGDFVGRLRNLAEIGKGGTWTEQALKKMGIGNDDKPKQEDGFTRR
jgi:hypothetical protein